MKKENINYHMGFINSLEDNEIFIFGSNLQGLHGAGAALTARNRFDAKMGIGKGLTGQSYAFPTIKSLNPYTKLTVKEIEQEVNDLEIIIKENNNKKFYLTAVGCGLAGYDIKNIAPLFKKLIKYDNIVFPIEFKSFIKKDEK